MKKNLSIGSCISRQSLKTVYAGSMIGLNVKDSPASYCGCATPPCTCMVCTVDELGNTGVYEWITTANITYCGCVASASC
ncbi:MAG: hypothetical protein QM528_04600 [Phycisphaerales bacterium]|nr:hypothetical protein [Phycisphaerales bacterium]